MIKVNAINNNNLELICFILGVIAIILGVLVIYDYWKERKARKQNLVKKEQIELAQQEEVKIENKESDTLETTKKIKPIYEIKYVEEDAEIEKTKAQLELARVKEELIKQEEKNALDKIKPKEEVVALQSEEKEKKQEQEISKPKENPVFQVEEAQKEIENTLKMEAIKEEKRTEPEEAIELEQYLEQAKLNYEQEQEEKAIISVDELEKAANTIYSDEEMYAYKDEGNEPISIQELEALYKDFASIAVQPMEIEEQKKMKDTEIPKPVLKEISSEKTFQNTPFISPIYGVNKTEDNLLLEQTANLEKLNEEIKKTNEFLNALRELRKNLE